MFNKLGECSHKLFGVLLITAILAVAGSNIFVALNLRSLQLPANVPAAASGGIDEKVLTEKIDAGIKAYVDKQVKEVNAERQKAAEKAQEDAGKNLIPPKSDDHLRGEKNTTITLIEYSDYECPFCKKFHETPKEILAAYKGKVNWIYRHFPLGFHDPLATKEAIYAECVNELKGNNAFWTYSDTIYANTKSNGTGLTEDDLKNFAKNVGADLTKLAACVDSGKYDDKIKKSIEEGSKAGVDGTPATFVYNNKTKEIKLVSGAYSLNDFKAIIDAMLTKK